MPIQIAHIALWTRDLEKAAQFWVRYFNATLGEIYHSKNQPGFKSIFLALPGTPTQIELMTSPRIELTLAKQPIGYAHIAISLDSKSAVDALAAQCQSDGCLLSPPRTTGDGYYEALLQTPDGTPVEITCNQ